MSIHKASRAACLLGCAMIAILIAFSCTTPVKVGIKFTGLGFTVEGTVDSAGNPITKVSGALDPGKCLKIEFRGADGGLISTAIINVPGSTQIPDGAKSQSFSEVDCPPTAQFGAMPLASGSTRQRSAVPFPEWMDVFGLPVLPDLVDGGVYKNALYHFRVLAQPGTDAFTVIEPILRNGPGTSIGSSVDVISFTQFIPEAFGGRLIAADTHPFDEFRFDWNGTPGYSDLGTNTNVVQYDAGNSWNVIESFIPLQDFNASVGDINQGTTTRKTVVEQQSQILNAQVIVTSY